MSSHLSGSRSLIKRCHYLLTLRMIISISALSATQVGLPRGQRHHCHPDDYKDMLMYLPFRALGSTLSMTRSAPRQLQTILISLPPPRSHGNPQYLNMHTFHSHVIFYCYSLVMLYLFLVYPSLALHCLKRTCTVSISLLVYTCCSRSM